jgi:hypothetical protein
MVVCGRFAWIMHHAQVHDRTRPVRAKYVTEPLFADVELFMHDVFGLVGEWPAVDRNYLAYAVQHADQTFSEAPASACYEYRTVHQKKTLSR